MLLSSVVVVMFVSLKILHALWLDVRTSEYVQSDKAMLALPLLCASSCERELTATLHREQ